MICLQGALQRSVEDLRGFFSYKWSGSRTGLCLYCVFSYTCSELRTGMALTV